MASTSSAESYRAAVDQIRLDVIKAMALRAALELGLFTPLAEGQMTVKELSNTIGIKPED